MWFDDIKYFYEKGHPLYTNENLKIFVQAEMLTPEQYYEITGVPYV